MTDRHDGGPAFPQHKVTLGPDGITLDEVVTGGMTLRDWFAGQALANPVICSGEAADYQIVKWFSQYSSGITSTMICAKQAYEYADAMLLARSEAKP